MDSNLKMIEDYDNIRAALTRACPFISSFLRKVRVYAWDRIPTAGVSKNNVLYINPKFWMSLRNSEKAWVLGHEVLHIAFQDLPRRGERHPEAWNIVADAINNELENDLIQVNEADKIVKFSVRLWNLFREFADHLGKKGIDFNKFKTKTKEEIYDLIPWKFVKIRINIECENDLRSPDGDECGSQSKNGRKFKLQDGSKDFYEKTDKDEVKRAIKEAIAEAFSAQKMAGSVPGSLQRLVDKTLKSEVRWETLFRQTMRIGFGRNVIDTWRRPSRRHPNYPGLKRIRVPTVWVLVDTSGSISSDELLRFISEVYAIAKTHPVKIIFWDAIASDPFFARNPREVIKASKQARGGGGTVIGPALEKTLQEMRHGDVVIVFTDGYIYDLDNPDTKQEFEKVLRKSSVGVFATTGQLLNSGGWVNIKIKIKT